MAYLKKEKTQKEPEKINQKWFDRVTRAKKCHKSWFEKFQVGLSREFYYGAQLPPGETSDEFIAINKIYAHLQTQLPTLYSVNPYFYVKLKKSFAPDQIKNYELMGKLRQAALNYYKEELDLKSKARLSILDAEFAYGVVKTRYCFDEKENEKGDEPILGEDGKPIKGEDGEILKHPKVLPTNERFEVLRIHPDDLIFSEDCGPLEYSWPFIAERVRMTREQALADKRLDKQVVQNVKGYKEPKDDENSAPPTFWQTVKEVAGVEKKPEDNDLLIFWEIYDLQHKQMLMICEGAEDPVMKPGPLPKGVDKHPYSILRFSLTDDGPYPLPPVSQAIDLQKEFNLARSRILKHRKRFNRKYTAIHEMLNDESELSKLEVGDDGTVIGVKAHGAIQPIQDAPLDQASYQELALLNNDIIEIFGTPNPARGIASSDSATEASIMDKYQEIREGDKLSSVTDFLIDIGRKLDMLIQANFDKDMAVKVVGPRGEEWFQLSKDAYQDIQGEYEYSVNVGATQPRLPDIERAQWTAFMSQVVVPFPHILTAPAIMKRMAEMYHIEDEAALEEFARLGQQIMSGQAPMPGGGGSQPGIAENNPVAAILGSAMGQTGGNVNGGGSPQSASAQ